MGGIGAPFNGLKAFATTDQLGIYDKLANALALGTSPIVKALFNFDAAMVRDRDAFLGRPRCDPLIDRPATLKLIRSIFRPTQAWTGPNRPVYIRMYVCMSACARVLYALLYARSFVFIFACLSVRMSICVCILRVYSCVCALWCVSILVYARVRVCSCARLYVCIRVRVLFFFTLLLSSFWTSRGHRCRSFFPPVLAFFFYRA